MYLKLNRQNASKEFDKLLNGQMPNYKELNPLYSNIRNELLKMHNMFKDKQKYDYDLHFALELYKYFSLEKYGYSNLSNYDFWRYICLKVAPDIIESRRGLVAEYFFKKNVRMHFPTLWWYIHLSWQGDLESTKEVLLKHNTDTIQSLVERPGKMGVYLDTYRSIIYFYNLLDQKDKLVYKDGNKKSDYLLRSIMVLHTAKCLTISPEIMGINDYVIMLFQEMGIKFERRGTSYGYSK